MSTDPNEVLVKRSDLLPVEEEDGFYLVDDLRYAKDNKDAAALRRTATRILSVVSRMEDDAAKIAAQEAAEWELEHAVPLARKMHDTFHSFSSNYPEVTDEDLWLRNYKRDNYLVKQWVATASAALKAQEAENVAE